MEEMARAPYRDRGGDLRWAEGSAGGRYLCRGRRSFYHVAPCDALGFISREGLLPERRRLAGVSLEYPTGVYLFSSEEAAVNFSDMVEREEVDEYGEGEAMRYAIITVRPAPGMVLLQDPFSDDESGLGRYSLYTPDGIPALRLTLPVMETEGAGLSR
jgi:hypothetical protein